MNNKAIEAIYQIVECLGAINLSSEKQMSEGIRGAMEIAETFLQENKFEIDPPVVHVNNISTATFLTSVAPGCTCPQKEQTWNICPVHDSK